YVAPLPDGSAGTSRYLVVAPGAARVRVLDPEPEARPVPATTSTKGDVTVVRFDGGIRSTPPRVLVEDAEGRDVFDGATTPGRPLVDPISAR
ncbi:MAG: hypothetical protein ACRCY9_00070, partial [Phycicoccus sp.]